MPDGVTCRNIAGSQGGDRRSIFKQNLMFRKFVQIQIEILNYVVRL